MKKVVILFTAFAMCVSLFGCTETLHENAANSKLISLEKEISELDLERSSLEAEISQLKDEKTVLEQEIADTKEDIGTAKYVVTLNIRQRHFSLDLGDVLKDSLNDISIEIPVDKEYFDSIEIGDTIDDSFRVGSLIFKGSFGSWDITVEDKEIQ